MFNYFIFNNKKSTDLDIYMLKGFETPYPTEIIESQEVEGRRNGTLTDKTGNYNDIIFDVNCRMMIKGDRNYKTKELFKWINNIEDNRIYFKNNLDKCYKVKYCNITSIKEESHSIDFTINFRCNPFFYDTYFKNLIVEGESEGNRLQVFGYNYGDLPSYPKITIYLKEQAQSNYISIIRYPEEDEDNYGVFFNPGSFNVRLSPNVYKVVLDMENLTAYEFYQDQYGTKYKNSISHKLERGGYFDIKPGEFELYIITEYKGIKIQIDKNQAYLF